MLSLLSSVHILSRLPTARFFGVGAPAARCACALVREAAVPMEERGRVSRGNSRGSWRHARAGSMRGAGA